RAGPIGIEDADRVHRQLVDAVPMQDRLLALVLAQGVGILRSDAMALTRGRRRQAVTRGGCRIDEFGNALPTIGRARAFEHRRGALDIRRHVLEWPLDRWHDVANSGEMKHVANAIEERVARAELANIGAPEINCTAARVLLKI